MNQRVKNELSALSLIAAATALSKGKAKTSWAFTVAALTLYFYPPARRFSFADKSVVLTGGSRGLGLALAKRLLTEGARVTLLARDVSELERAAALLAPLGKVGFVVCDVTKARMVQKALKQVADQHGRIDVLINDAGAISVGPFATMETADFEAQMNVHLWGVINTTRSVIPFFRAIGGGRIVNICSIAAKFPHPHMSPYTTSKYALSGFSKSVTSELAAEKILVTTVYPGLMRTGSYVQAVFKGDHEKEFSWFAASDLTPGLSISAEHAAWRILEATRDGNSELVLSIPAKLGALAYSLVPGLCDYAMSFYARTLPKGLSRERKTGAESQGEFNSKAWSQPLQTLGTKAQELYNQADNRDAEFNMGLRSDKLLH